MSSLAMRTARAATAGLLGLLVSAPPPALADDGERRGRPHAARWERGDRGGPEREARRPDHHGERPDRGREARSVEHHGARPDRGRDRNGRRDERRVDRDRHEHRGRPGPPPRVVREERERDHRHAGRDDRRWREHRDPRAWRDDRGWRHDRRDDRRDHKWRPAYAQHHDQRWHWHDGRWCPPGHRHPPGRRVGWTRPRDDWRWARYRRPMVVHSPYYCAPCAHWYEHRHDFDRHLYGYHRLPQRSFQDAVAQVVWGLVYFGL